MRRKHSSFAVGLLTAAMVCQMISFPLMAKDISYDETHYDYYVTASGNGSTSGDGVSGDDVSGNKNKGENYPDLWVDGIKANKKAEVFQSGYLSEVYRDTQNRLVFVKGAKYNIYDIWGSGVSVYPFKDDKVNSGKYFKITKKGELKAKKQTNNAYLVINGVKTKCVVMEPRISNLDSDSTYNVGDVIEIGLNKGTATDDFSLLGAYIAWYTTDPNVAFVSGNKIYMAGVGNAEITAEVCGKKYKKKVEVEANKKISNAYVFMSVDQKVKIYYMRKTSSSTSDESEYTKKKCHSMEPQNTQIAEASDGEIIGIAPGHTVVKATYFTNDEKTKTDFVNIQVYVEDPHLNTNDRLTLIKEKKNTYEYNLELKKGEQYAIAAQGIDFGMHRITWKANKKSKNVAAANDKGVFYGLKDGTAKYKAKINKKTIKINVIVSGEESHENQGIVQFLVDEGTTPYPQLVDYGKKALLPVLAPRKGTSSKGNPVFEGWLDENGSVYEIEDSLSFNYMSEQGSPERYFKNPVNSDMLLRAKWSYYVSTETVGINFNLFNSSKKPYTAKTYYVKKGTRLNPSVMPRIKPTLLQSNRVNKGVEKNTLSENDIPDYEFLGWSTDMNGTTSDKVFDLNGIINSDAAIKLYPIFAKKAIVSANSAK